MNYQKCIIITFAEILIRNRNRRKMRSEKIISREIIRQFVVYYQFNSRTYSLNDLDFKWWKYWLLVHSIVHNCELALKWWNVYTAYAIPRRAAPSLAWPSHDMKISHECETQACTPIAVNCVHNRRKQCSWLTRSTTKSMVNSVSRLSSLTSFPMRSSIMSRAQSASTDSRSVFDRFGTRTAIFFPFERFDYTWN